MYMQPCDQLFHPTATVSVLSERRLDKLNDEGRWVRLIRRAVWMKGKATELQSKKVWWRKGKCDADRQSETSSVG